MSVLIKGMEMPERCGEKCLAYDVDKNDGFPSCRASKYTGKPTFKAFHQNGVIFPDGCPLVEVPAPHGRLIDGDAIPYVASENGCADDYAYRYDIYELPTVIEAEEEG